MLCMAESAFARPRSSCALPRAWEHSPGEAKNLVSLDVRREASRKHGPKKQASENPVQLLGGGIRPGEVCERASWLEVWAHLLRAAGHQPDTGELRQLVPMVVLLDTHVLGFEREADHAGTYAGDLLKSLQRPVSVRRYTDRHVLPGWMSPSSCQILPRSSLVRLSQAGKVLLDSGLLKDPSTCKQAAHDSFVGLLDHKFQRSEPCGALAL